MLHEHAIVDFVRAAFSTVTSGECYFGSSMLVYTLTIYMRVQHISILQTSYTSVH